jgi:hypothetical protein
MQTPDPAAPEQPLLLSGEPAPIKSTPRGDFFASLFWIVLGVAIAIGSWNMDRLKNQDVNPYTVPGLLPFFLGIAIAFFGLLMLWRSWRQGALSAGAQFMPSMSASDRNRLFLVLALCLGFGGGLVGHGLPFWLAAAIFVAATIVILQWQQRKADNQVGRGVIVAIVIGVCAGIAITLVFQEFFLVRLP